MTYYDTAMHIGAPASENGLAKLDIALVPSDWAHHAIDVKSDRRAELPARHVLTIMQLSMEVRQDVKQAHSKHRDVSALQSQPPSQAFANRFGILGQLAEQNSKAGMIESALLS